MEDTRASKIASIDAILEAPGVKPNYSQLTLHALVALTRVAHPDFSACFQRILSHMEAQAFMQTGASLSATPT